MAKQQLKKVRKILQNPRHKKKWQPIAGIAIVLLFITIAIAVNHTAWASFYRTEGDTTAFEYGYGYGYDTFDTMYGYGYYVDTDATGDYGFEGSDGKATSVSASSLGSSGVSVSYTTSYYAKNKVYYGTTNTTCASLGSNTTQTGFQTGSQSANITSLTCGTTYYYCVASEDAGANTWYTAVGSVSTANCGGGGGTGGGSVVPVTPATTTTATTTTATTTPATTTVATTTVTLTKPISQMTMTELRAKMREVLNLLISLLTQLIGQWQIQLQTMVATGHGQSVPAALRSLDLNLKYGNMGTAVKLLQTWLAQDKAIYPAGILNGIFGPATKAAVIKFQEKYKAEILTPNGLTRGNGFVGASTRAKLNSLYGSQ